MAKSNRLRTRDLRRLYNLMGECCELGADPLAWRQHLAMQIPALFGGQIGQCFEVKVIAPPFVDPFWLFPLVVVDYGWATPGDRKPFEAHLQGGRPEDGPHITPDLLRSKRKTVQWSGQYGRSAWLRSWFYNEFVKPGHLDDGIMGHHRDPSGEMCWLFVNRALGDPPFDQRDCRRMTLLSLEVARLLGKRLARVGGPTVSDLSPRQHDVLVCLMSGDSERQAALRLGISHHTVHDYVKMLHARFGVSSRGELLARCRALWPVLERRLPESDSLYVAHGFDGLGLSTNGQEKR